MYEAVWRHHAMLAPHWCRRPQNPLRLLKTAKHSKRNARRRPPPSYCTPYPYPSYVHISTLQRCAGWAAPAAVPGPPAGLASIHSNSLCCAQHCAVMQVLHLPYGWWSASMPAASHPATPAAELFRIDRLSFHVTAAAAAALPAAPRRMPRNTRHLSSGTPAHGPRPSRSTPGPGSGRPAAAAARSH